ncbi:hypothetical protein IVA95_15275 [Bradyrhizobium sp. 157]|uniref:hypothetical protein n=1 Tax=Bradyrhizobium sp. 157 TaxID=2782631 RepID=UPI001FF98473|nr:hypothetical protein [Bradyrhizobium sp. 157]MCK1638931.1 hypothetical protein [Bradyrhizobium sp. 157]
MLTLVAGALESLVDFCMLFADMATDINSIQPTIQNVNLPVSSPAQSGLEWRRLCEGRSLIKRAARMLASDGDHRSLFDFHIFAARLFIA